MQNLFARENQMWTKDADVMTKSFPRVRLEELRRRMGFKREVRLLNEDVRLLLYAIT